MSAQTRRRPRAGVAGALMLALTAALLGLPVAPGPPAAAVEPEPQDVSITLTEVSPVTLDRDDTLTVRGTATNLRQTPVTQLQLLLWRDQGTLYTDPAQLADLAAAPSTLPVGARVLVESAYTQDLPPSLAPGQSVDFELSATVADLGLPAGDGAALVGVQAREAASTTVGRVRTLVPLVTEEHPPVPVTTVVALGATPTRVRPDVVADESLGQQLEPDGRLDVLLRSAAREGVSWAVDPRLLAEVGDLADGYRVLTGPDGSETTPGAHAGAAARWLTAFAELPREQGHRLPWGEADLVSVARHADDVLSEAVVHAQRDSGLGPAEGLPLLVAPAGGTVDAATLALVDAMAPAAVLVAGGEGSAVGLRPGAPTVLDVDADAFTPVLGPDPRTSPPQVAGHLATGTLMTSLAPGGTDGPAPQLRLVETVEQAAADAATDGLPWQTRVGLPRLLEAADAPWDGRLDAPLAGAAGQLDPEVLDSAVVLHHDTRAAGELLSDPTEAADADREAATAVSTWWRADRSPAAREAWLAPRTARLHELLEGDGIELTVADNVAMSARSGQFPVSVTNRLDRAVRVQVLFTTDNQTRLSIPAVTGLEVRPGQTVTATAAPRARANGSVVARAQLATGSGRPFGPSEEITIQASEIGRAGWVIVIGSGIVLIGGTVLRVRQVRRQQALRTTAEEAAAAPAHQEGTPR